MHPLCPPAAPHLQPEPALALGSRMVRGCGRLPCFGQRRARGCCLDLQASGERGPQGEIQPSQMQRSGCSEQGVPGTLPWGSIQTALCARLGHVCWRASSQGGFSKRNGIWCCVMHVVTSLLSVHTKDHCGKFHIQVTKTQVGTLVCGRAFRSLG